VAGDPLAKAMGKGNTTDLKRFCSTSNVVTNGFSALISREDSQKVHYRLTARLERIVAAVEVKRQQVSRGLRRDSELAS
jgi:hypothetical protein